jgi:hypothetical protein
MSSSVLSRTFAGLKFGGNERPASASQFLFGPAVVSFSITSPTVKLAVAQTDRMFGRREHQRAGEQHVR